MLYGMLNDSLRFVQLMHAFDSAERDLFLLSHEAGHLARLLRLALFLIDETSDLRFVAFNTRPQL